MCFEARICRTTTLLLIVLLGTACDESVSPFSSPSAASSARAALAQRREELDTVFTACDRDSDTLAPALVAQARCLRFSRPENPQQPAGRTIDLKLMLIPAIRALPEADPLVILVGGPGQAATSAGLMPAQILSDIRRERDILLLDQRGTGTLSPFAACDFEAEEEGLPLELALQLELQEELLAECLARIDADPRWYTTDMAVADLEALREYLGYERFNLWGGSYGTRVALTYLRMAPESLRAVVLDGVAPAAIKLPLYTARDASAALQALFEACQQDLRCHGRFPDLDTRFQRLLLRLEEQPLSTRLTGPDGRSEEIDVTADILRVLTRLLLYSREAGRLLPLLIEQFEAGDMRALAALLSAPEEISQGLFLSVVCSEDVPLIQAAERSAMLASNAPLASPLLLSPVLAACEHWPTRTLDPAYSEPVETEVPVLLFSGALDPVTPARWADSVLPGLSSSRHLVVEGVAHIALPYGCVGRLVTTFINHPEPQALSAACLDELRQRPFFMNPGGSTQAND